MSASASSPASGDPVAGVSGTVLHRPDIVGGDARIAEVVIPNGGEGQPRVDARAQSRQSETVIEQGVGGEGTGLGAHVDPPPLQAAMELTPRAVVREYGRTTPITVGIYVRRTFQAVHPPEGIVVEGADLHHGGIQARGLEHDVVLDGGVEGGRSSVDGGVPVLEGDAEVDGAVLSGGGAVDDGVVEDPGIAGGVKTDARVGGVADDAVFHQAVDVLEIFGIGSCIEILGAGIEAQQDAATAAVFHQAAIDDAARGAALQVNSGGAGIVDPAVDDQGVVPVDVVDSF